MLVLIVDSGRVEKRLVETAEEISVEDLEALRRQLNEKLANERLSRAELVLDAMAGEVPPGRRGLFQTLAAAIGQFVGDQTSERVWLGGQAHIAGPGALTDRGPSARSTRRWSSRCWCCACSRPPWAATSGCRW